MFLILVVTKLTYAIIKHRLLLDSSSFRVYVHEIIYHASHESTSSCYTALVTQNENPETTYTLQAYDSKKQLSPILSPSLRLISTSLVSFLFLCDVTYHFFQSLHIFFDVGFFFSLTIYFKL